jgi:uncharacterized membrane protein
MSIRPEFLFFLSLLAASSLLCRFGGFWMMRFVSITPRVEAALKATPLAVMAGIVMPAMVRGSWPEWVALGATVAAMRIVGNDSAAAIAGVVVVAVLRSGHLFG